MAFRGIQSTNIISTEVGFTDPLLILNKDGSTAVDVGFLGKIGATSYAGLVKDSSTDEFLLINSISLGSTSVNSVDATDLSLVKGDLTAGAITATSFTGDGSALTGTPDTNTTYTSSDFTHDDLTGFVANEHIDWTSASAGTIHASNYTDTDTTYSVGDGGLTQNNFTTTLKNKLDTIEYSADATDTANVTSAGALMDSEVTNLADVKAFDTTDYATAAQGTTADAALPKAGGTMTGTIASFTSTGIDDNATSNVVTIASNNRVDFAGGGNAFGIHLKYNTATSGVYLGSPSNQAFQISSAGGAPYLNIDSSGNVGIGTSSPNAKAHIVGTANAIALRVTNSAVDGNNADVMHIEPSNGAYYGNHLRIQSGRSDFSSSLLFLNTTSGMNGTNGSYIRVQNNSGADIFRVKGDGNVGVGTSSPSQKLHVAGNIYTTGYLNTAGSGTAGGVQFADGNLYMYRDTNDLVFKLQGSEKMRINSSGNVGVGTSSPASLLDLGSTGGRKLLLYGNSATNMNTQGFGIDLGGNSYSSSWWFPDGSSGSGRAEILSWDGSSYTSRFVVKGDGNVGIGVTPAVKLHVKSASTGATALRLTDGARATVSVDFPATSQARWAVGAAEDTLFASGAATVLKVGNVNGGSDVEISAGNLVIGTSGKGIDFSADGNASGMTSEVLDDYEEGTWTPVIESYTGTNPTVGGTSSGQYTKIGNLVTIAFNFDSITIGGTTSGILAIRGLPYSSSGDWAGTINTSSINFVRTDTNSLQALGTDAFGILSSDGGSWGWELVSAISSGAAAIRGTVTYKGA